MTPQAATAVGAMFNYYHLNGTDADLLIATLSHDLRDVREDAIIETARAFRRGDVDRPNRQYAPSGEQFVEYVRKIHEQKESADRFKARPALPAPRKRQSPFDRNLEKIAAEMEGWSVIATGVSHMDFATGCKSNAYPAGSTWRADGKVYAIEKGAQL